MNPDPVTEDRALGRETTRKNIRGSSLLLIGRMFSLIVNFGLQVVIVRTLTKADFGAFAYALSMVAVSTNLCLLGLNKAITRFLPLYDERKDERAMFGTMVLAFGTSVGLGLLVTLGVFLGQGFLSEGFVKDPMAVSVLVILVVLVPLDAADNLFQGLLAVFAKPRAIFFRRHILSPILKISAVGAVIVFAGSVRMLAAGYVVATAIGVLVYVRLVSRAARDVGLRIPRSRDQIRLPLREVFSFSIPLLTMDAFFNMVTATVVLLLERNHSTLEVAELRAVLPVARLNFMVLHSLHLLFTPAATRMFARNETRGLGDLYWQTGIWIAVVTFPIFALGCFAAGPVTVTLFGDQYQGAGLTLSILAVGYYICAVFGISRHGLQVVGHIRSIVITSAVAFGVVLLLALALIPPLGITGAAIAAATGLALQGILGHVLLTSVTPISLFPSGPQTRARIGVYVSILVAATILLGLQYALALPLAGAVLLTGALAIGLLRYNREALDIARTFPEIDRIPILRQLLGIQRS